jgi:hypothetical protein
MLVLLVASCSNDLYESQQYYQFNDEMIGTYTTVDVEELNDVIKDNNADMYLGPVSLALMVLKVNLDQKNLLISQDFPSIEEKNRVVITIVRDGYPDDATRGEWDRLELQKEIGGGWKILTAKHAVSCWRSDSQIFQNKPCP